MNKLDEMRRSAGGFVAESMGAGTIRPAGDGSRPPTPGAAPAPPARLRGVVRSANAAEIPVDRIGPDPDQPREEFEPEAIERLAESLKTRGQLQPARVRWDEARDQYVLIYGERRWRAAQLAGLKTLACTIADGPATPGELLALQLVENALREDLRPIEQARAYRALMDLNGWSIHQVARELAICRQTVIGALKLLDLPESVQREIEDGTISPTSGYEIAKAPAEAREQLADRVRAEGLTRDEVREASRQAGRAAGASSKPKGRGAGKGKARKATSRTFRISGGKVMIENRRGLDDATIRAMLAEAMAQIDAEMGERPADAA